MKRILSVLLVGLFVFAAVGSAKAAFDSGELVRVVYRTDGTVEVGTSLGQIGGLLSGSNLTVGNGANYGIDLSDFGAGATWDNLRVAYFAFDQDSYEAWASDKLGTPLPKNGAFGTFDTMQAVTNSIQKYYNQLPNGSGPSPAQVIANKTNADSYWKKANSDGNTIGDFSGFIAIGDAEESLANLLNSNGYIDLGFYYWNGINVDTNGALAATIRTAIGTDGFGQTIINPTGGPVVPVPAAVWLLGTGLVGLVGIRRRKS